MESILAAGLWSTHADPPQLESAILNLCVNAHDAMPDGGKLTVETSNAYLDDRYARQIDVPVGQYVLIAVSDTGAGMTPDVLARAFDPFFTTKGVGKGTGLGLSQVHGFVKQSGGHLKIYSEPGLGTTVRIYLPRLDETGAGRRPGAAGEEAGPRALEADRGRVILVVEDEARMRELSVSMLRELGYTVIHADGAGAALRQLGAHPEVALMFTDIVMPETDGSKLADEALLRRPGLKVLFTTGFSRNVIDYDGVLEAEVNFIAKPFTLDKLAVKVRAVLARDGMS
ncbi:MAG: ATP-binding protein [Hyphomicrobiales bacterium]